MIRAAKLDAQLYEEVKKDTEATKEAFLVELIGAISLGIIPGISLIIRFIASIWVLVAFIVAVRQALNRGTVTAILISVVGAIAFMIVFATFSAIVSSL